MNKRLVVSGGVIILIIIAVSVYFLFFYKSDTPQGNGGKITSVFDDFFKRMDEKYTIKSDKAAVQFLELLVGNTLKIAEEFLELPDIKWALENQLLEGVNVPNINNAISPVFDCMANKVKEVGQDPDLIAQWNEFDVDTNGFENSEPVFFLGVAQKFNTDMMSCIQSEATEERLSVFRTEYNKIIGNINDAVQQEEPIQTMPDDFSVQDLKDATNKTYKSIV